MTGTAGLTVCIPISGSCEKRKCSRMRLKQPEQLSWVNMPTRWGYPDTIADYYEFQTPIFVLTHTVPETLPKENENLKFTFVTNGIESAISRAKEAAGAKNVLVIGGASLPAMPEGKTL